MLRPDQANEVEGELSLLRRRRAWKEVVAKPAVGINAAGSMRSALEDPSLAHHPAGLLQTGDALIQLFLRSILSEGELSLIFVDSVFTHAVRKRPRLGDCRVQDNHGGSVQPCQPSERELAVASAALACAPSPTTYACVDLAYVDDAPAVMELELVEPELFLRFSPAATAALARAVLVATAA